MTARRFAAHCSLFILHCLFLSACSSPTPIATMPEPTTLRLVAADACGPLMEELAAAYQDAHPWATVEVEVFDDKVARERLQAGAADLAALSWSNDGELWSIPFASDAVVVIVHPAVALEELDRETLREIWRGRMGEWPDGVPIQVISRESGSGVRAVFDTGVLDGYDVTLTALVVPDSAGMVEAAALTPGAIGYVSQARLDGPARVVPVEGAALGYSLSLATRTEPEGEARSFIQWVLGPAGQARVTQRFGSPP